MKLLCAVLTAPLVLTSCWSPSNDNPPGFKSFGRSGDNSAIAGADACHEEGFSHLPFHKAGFVVGYTHPVRIATGTPDAPTLRSSSPETIRVEPDSRVEVPLDPTEYEYSSPPIVHTWMFQIKALVAGDAELIVERNGEDIDAFTFNARDASRWYVDESPIAFKMTASGTAKRVLEAYDESGSALAHNVSPHWTAESSEIVAFGYGSASMDTACAKLVRGDAVGQTTVSATSPVGSWLIPVTVTTD